MKTTIRISNNGNTIRATGAAANELLKALTEPEPPKQTVSKYGHQIGNTCKACDCVIDAFGCGCNPHDA